MWGFAQRLQSLTGRLWALREECITWVQSSNGRSRGATFSQSVNKTSYNFVVVIGIMQYYFDELKQIL
jgi:hypothetical protein